MAKYHINSKTDRPNKCNATVRSCPVGGLHFDSKEEAAEHIQAELSDKYDALTVHKKEPTARVKAMIPRTTGQIAAARLSRFRSLMTVNTGWTTAEQLESDITEDLRDYADYEHPGCGGCDGSQSDYCRCKVYTGQVSASSTQMATEFYHRYSNDRSYKLYGRMSEDEKALIGDIAELFDKHGISDPSGYEVESSHDYYGENLDRISVNTPEKFEELHKDLEEIFKDDDEWSGED